MKRYVKNLWAFDDVTNNPVPSFLGQREAVTCYHCGHKTIIAVPTTGIDWEKAAKCYKDLCDQMWLDLNSILAENEMPTVMHYKLEQMLKRIRNNFDKNNP